MTEQARERLSALVDAQLSPSEISSEIEKLVSKPGNHEAWYRYHLIGDAIRQETGPLIDARLVEQIAGRLKDEPVIIAPNALKARSVKWHKPTAGFAIAASVALMAITFAPQLVNQETGSEPHKEIASAQPSTERIYVAEDGTRWELLKRPDVESRLNSYLVNHQEFSPAGNMKGIMPYATFVSYDGGQ